MADLTTELQRLNFGSNLAESLARIGRVVGTDKRRRNAEALVQRALGEVSTGDPGGFLRAGESLSQLAGTPEGRAQLPLFSALSGLTLKSQQIESQRLRDTETQEFREKQLGVSERRAETAEERADTAERQVDISEQRLEQAIKEFDAKTKNLELKFVDDVDEETGERAQFLLGINSVTGKIETRQRAGLAKPEKRVQPTFSDAKFISEHAGVVAGFKELEETFDESFVGPVQGPLGATGSVLGEFIPALAISAEREEFRALVAEIRNRYFKLLGGVAINPAEAERLMEQFPTMNDSNVAFVAKLKQSKKSADRVLEKFLEVRGLNPQGQQTGESLQNLNQQSPFQNERNILGIPR